MASGHESRALWAPELQERLVELEELHRRTPHDRSIMIRLARFLLAQQDVMEAQKYLRRAAMGLTQQEDAHKMMIEVGNGYLQAWRVMKSITIQDVEEVYMGDDRNFILAQANQFFQQAIIVEEVKTNSPALMQAAFAKECMGELNEALNIISEIITNHPDHSIVPSAILKAGTLLHHLGEFKRSREYLEFLADVDLPAMGISNALYYAELIALYEDYSASDGAMARRLDPQLRVAYVNLQRWLYEERRELDEEKYGSLRRLQREHFRKCNTPWVELATDCLRSCDYVLVVHFLLQAVQRTAHPTILLLLAEALWMLKENDRAIVMLERALAMDPEHLRIKQLLRRWAPGKYEKASEELGGDVPERFAQAAAVQRPQQKRDSVNASKKQPPPATTQPRVQGEAQTASSPVKPSTVARKKVVYERSLFQTLQEEMVTKVVRRAIDNKMGYVPDNKVLRVLSDFNKYKMKYEVANTRVRLQKVPIISSRKRGSTTATTTAATVASPPRRPSVVAASSSTQQASSSRRSSSQPPTGSIPVPRKSIVQGIGIDPTGTEAFPMRRFSVSQQENV